MSDSAESTTKEPPDDAFEQRIAALRVTPEERARVLASAAPFDYDAWVQQSEPATPEELAEMEELLRERDVERQRSLASEKERLREAG